MPLAKKIGLRCLFCAAPVLCPLAVMAQQTRPAAPEPAASATAAQQSRIRFQIAAQPLIDALCDFSSQANVHVEVDVELAAVHEAPAVTGTFTRAEALERLLAGTELKAEFAGGTTVYVRRADDGARVYALTPLTVVGRRSRGYAVAYSSTGTKTDTPLRDVPQAVSVITREVIADQSMQGMADVVRYVPGVSMGQGEGHRDAPTIRGNSSTADFFVDGVRDDAQYYRDLYNTERVEALKGSNAMVFGRGGGGGILNRVSKTAQWTPTRELTAEGGSFDHKRSTVDVGQGFGSVAVRLAGMYENSGGYRNEADLERYGVNPMMAFAVGARTAVHAGYEFFSDDRTVDRGVPSFEGRPFGAEIETFFGNPDSSYATTRVHAATATVEHRTAGGLNLRNRTRFTSYDKFYQNSFPGAVNDAGTQVTLAAYNNATDRSNLFNQTDLTTVLNTGAIEHTLLVGAELGRQETENFRQTGYYNNATTSIGTPLDHPTVVTPITFRQSATDADNRSKATVAGVYIQDQVRLSRQWQLIGGVRFDRFAVDFHNNRTGEDLKRTDDLISPRAGLVFKPIETASLYGSYSVSYLPSSGDQFSSLNASTETLEPEQFTNYELGAKWDVGANLALTAAVYRLDRTNTSAPDPNDPARTVQTGSQRNEGIEVGASGNITPDWQLMGGVAFQRAEITSRTKAAQPGAKVALVPERTFSLWNKYQLFDWLGAGVGVVHQSDMFAAIDNNVTLPGFTRTDGALYVRLVSGVTAQLNVENLLDETYYGTSHGNNNIMPGAPRTFRLTLTTRR